MLICGGVGVPEQHGQAAGGFHALDVLAHLRSGCGRIQLHRAEERAVHGCERQLEQAHRAAALGVPRVEGRRDPGAEADRLVVAERCVVAEPGQRLRAPRASGLEAQEVLADARDPVPRRLLDLALLARQLISVEMAQVAAVEPDLEAALGERAHEPAHRRAPALEHQRILHRVQRVVLVAHARRGRAEVEAGAEAAP